jgi:hypothetical protein
MFVRDAKRWLFAEGHTAAYTAQQRALASRYFEAASRRLRLAGDLSSADAPLMPTVVLRDAIALLVRAAAAARDAAADGPRLARLDTSTALAELRAAAGRPPIDDTRRVDEAIATSDPLFFDSLDGGELRRTHDALAREAEWLRGEANLQSSTCLAATRIGRVAAVVVILAYLGYAGVSAIFAPRDLALHKPVHLSSQEPGTPAPSALVDGKKGGTYGAHTQVAQRPGWAIIDLEHEANLRKIVVYNRGDSNFNDGLPYAIDLSLDGKEFHEVARRDTPFGEGGLFSSPWSAAVHERARFVRIRAAWYLALSEVEVY